LILNAFRTVVVISRG